MLEELALAVRLQSLDRKIASLEAGIALIPKQIAEIERKLESHKRHLEADRAALVANQRDRKKFDGDIQVQQQKISKLRDQILLAKTNEQYKAFQNEIAYCEKEIRQFEDKILELMEKSDPLDKNVKAAEQSLKQEMEAVAKQQAGARAKSAVDKKELDEALAERAGIKAKLSPKFNADYERVRKKTKGTVVAEAVDGRCGACMVSLRPQFMQELKVGDQVMYCEICGRMLTYNPPVAFNNNVGPAATA